MPSPDNPHLVIKNINVCVGYPVFQNIWTLCVHRPIIIIIFFGSCAIRLIQVIPICMPLPEACDGSPTFKRWVLPNAGFSLTEDATSGQVPGPRAWRRGLPAQRPAPRARGFEPALGAQDGRESGKESLPAGGCPAFVSCFSSGGEDMVRPERLGLQRRCRQVRRSGRCAHEPERGRSAREVSGPRAWGVGAARGRADRGRRGGAAAARRRGAAWPARGCVLTSPRPVRLGAPRVPNTCSRQRHVGTFGRRRRRRGSRAGLGVCGGGRRGPRLAKAVAGG